MSADKLPTGQLQPGDVVLTTDPTGADFGLPLVQPAHSSRGKAARRVRNRVRCRGGFVVWFHDGTKTPPLHGRTAWLAGELEEEDGQR